MAGRLPMPRSRPIASGNPAVMEKVKVDTEIRKLDQLRAAHLNQHTEYGLRSTAAAEIGRRKERIEKLAADIAGRDAHEGNEFSMTAGGRVFSGKDARAQAAVALTQAC